MFEADLIFSCGFENFGGGFQFKNLNKNSQIEENFLPALDIWLVIDILRATTVITRWFELGGTELYPVKSPDAARSLVLDLKERGSSPLLMGEVNGIPPEGFDLGNSPVELNYELIQEHYCGVMSTTNGTVALNEAYLTGSPVIAVSFRNLSACLDYALKIGERIGILCSGRKKRPSWEDTLCAGALLENLNSRGKVIMSDSAKIALTVWQNEKNKTLISSVEKSEHADYLKHIGYGRDIIFACEVDAATVVPVLEKKNRNLVLKNITGTARAYGGSPAGKEINVSPNLNSNSNPNPLAITQDPFEELLNLY